MAEDRSVMDAFIAYCGEGHTDMDGKTFAKLCKDCGLVDKKMTATDVDLIFAKVVAKGQRRIAYPQFDSALSMCAQKKGVSAEEVKTKVGSMHGPVLHATKADAVRFHDDKSTYTGTHSHGGPESVPKGDGHAPQSASFGHGSQGLAGTLRPPDGHVPRHPSPNRAGSKEFSGRPSSLTRQGTGEMGRTPSKGASGSAMGRTPSRGGDAVVRTPSKGDSAMGRTASKGRSSGGAAAGTWQGTFQAYCGPGHSDMDGKSFAKLLKDCDLMDKNFTGTDADIIFAKCVVKGQRRVGQEAFREALRLVAERRQTPIEDVVDRVTAIQGPILHATVAEAVRFHDDKSTYTGTHAHGGPSSVPVGAGTATQLASTGMRVSN